MITYDVQSDLMGLDNYAEPVIEKRPWYTSGVYLSLSTVSAAVSGYHGIKRNNGSIGWGVAWFLLGAAFPILTPVVAVAQGFSKPIQ